MAEILSFSDIRAELPKNVKPRPRISTDLYIALRIRQLLSGHDRTWVMLEGTRKPNDGFSIRNHSQTRTVFIRLETYMGQARSSLITDSQKGRIRSAKDSALRVELFIGFNGSLRSVTVNNVKLMSDRGWHVYRLKKIMMGLLEEIDSIETWLSSQEEDAANMPADMAEDKIRRVCVTEEGVFGYIRGAGEYERTHRATRRGLSGKIHVSEPSSAKHSAYPGW